MTITENIMEICRVRTEYDHYRYLKHGEDLPLQLTLQTAYDIVKNNQWCDAYDGLKEIANKLIILKKEYSNG